MVNADQKRILEPVELSSLDAVALQDDDRIIWRHSVSMNHAIGKRQSLINPRHAVVHDHVRLLPHVPQNLRARQR